MEEEEGTSSSAGNGLASAPGREDLRSLIREIISEEIQSLKDPPASSSEPASGQPIYSLVCAHVYFHV